jgi:hypothetical protein
MSFIDEFSDIKSEGNKMTISLTQDLIDRLETCEESIKEIQSSLLEINLLLEFINSSDRVIKSYMKLIDDRLDGLK